MSDIEVQGVANNPLNLVNASWLLQGWNVFAKWLNSEQQLVSSFRASWIVPPAPANQGDQIIYLFTGLRDASNGGILIQPVLKWGPDPGDPDARGWSIASWLARSPEDPEPSQFSNSVRVNEGDRLTGEIILEEDLGESATYRCEFIGYPETVLQVDAPYLVYAVVTLETWNLMDCSDFPAASHARFFDLELRIGDDHPAIDWEPRNLISACGQETLVQSFTNPGGVIDLKFRSSPL